MRSGYGWTARLVALAALTAAAASPADAACKLFAFSVTDFGKDGPTKDAKDLLDKYIAEWAKERGIAKFTAGPKTVKCELYLNLVVVDEHTCKATANVCWEGQGVPKAVKTPAKK